MQEKLTTTNGTVVSFSGTRVRLQRLRDAKLFSGWILSMVDARVEVRIESGGAVEPGDEFFVQAFGDTVSAMFKATVTAKSRNIAGLEIVGDPKFVPSNEEIRILVEGLKCGVKLGWFEAVTDILDVSPHGIGIRTDVAVERGELVELSIVSTSGEIIAKGEVRYCRKVEGPGIDHRVGIALFEMDRITSAKWSRLLLQAMETPRAA